MSVSEIIIKGIGVILAVVGLLLLLAIVGIGGGITIIGGWFVWNIVVGIILIAIGVYLVRGGNISL